MRAKTPVYPSLGRYFRTMSELASSACMSRDKMTQIVNGKKRLTEAEKRAIVNAIVARLFVEGKTEEIKEIFEGYRDFERIFGKGANK